MIQLLRNRAFAQYIGVIKSMADNILDRFQTGVTEEKVVDTSKKIKVGIIGTGWIAEAHLKSYQQCPDVEVVALADLVPGKAEEFAKKYNAGNVRFYSSDKELIDNEPDIDAVSVCTYNMQHAPCTIYALEHGVNVMLEKPMCVTLEEAKAIRKAEKASGKVLSIGFQPRYDETVKQVKKIVQSGELGKIYYVQTGGGRRHGIPTPYGTTFIEQETAGIGALGDIGCYSLDFVLNALGYPKPLTVSGYTSGFFGKKADYLGKPEYVEKFSVDDFGAGFIRLENDIVLDFRIAWAMHVDSPGDTIFLGTEGGLRVPATDAWANVGADMTIYHNVAGQPVETTIPLNKNEGDNFYKKIRAFVDAVKYDLPAPVSSDEILYNQAIIDGIMRSSQEGREIIVDLD